MQFRNVTVPLPEGLQIMGDQGFANKSPLLLPLVRNGVPLIGRIKR